MKGVNQKLEAKDVRSRRTLVLTDEQREMVISHVANRLENGIFHFEIIVADNIVVDVEGHIDVDGYFDVFGYDATGEFVEKSRDYDVFAYATVFEDNVPEEFNVDDKTECELNDLLKVA